MWEKNYEFSDLKLKLVRDEILEVDYTWFYVMLNKVIWNLIFLSIGYKVLRFEEYE